MNRELDVKVARAKGLDVVGKLYANYHQGDWWLYWRDDTLPLEPVYVNHCMCDISYPDEKLYNGHTIACLNVVPFWSSDLNTTWQLVDEMKEECYSVNVQDRTDICYVDVTQGLGTYNIETMADTPQEAICNAYLEWRDLTKNQ